MSVSAKQHESAKGIHISTLSWSSLLPPSMSHSSGLLQRPGMSSLSHMEMPIGYLFYIWLCKFPCYSFHTLHPLFPPHPPPAIHCVHNSVLHVCVSTAALQIIPSVPSCSVQSFSHVWLFATQWTAGWQASLSITNFQSLLKLMSIESVILSNHLILCLSLLLLPSVFPSIRVFSNESVLHIRRPKYWSFSFSISPSNEYSGLISFRMDELDLFAVQGTVKSLLQHHSSKASILLCSASFILQLSHPYMTTGKTIALTRWTFVGKVMSLLFNMLSRLVITFLPRSKHV